MKKLLLTFLLAVVSSSAMAEWVEVVKSGEGIEEKDFITVYADPDTIQKRRYSNVDADTLSIKPKQEFACSCRPELPQTCLRQNCFIVG